MPTLDQLIGKPKAKEGYSLDDLIGQEQPPRKTEEHPPPVYGPSDVFTAPPAELWKGPGAQFTKGISKGWARSTQIPKLIGKEIPKAETKAGKVGEIVGATLESITELLGMGAALKGLGLLPRGASVLQKAGQTGITFGAQELTNQARLATAEAIYDEDFGSRGGIAVLESFVLGAVLSIAFSGAGAVWKKLKPTEQAKMLKTLGLKKGASLEQINKAAQKEAFKYHPDKAVGMRKQFEKVIKARDYLRKFGAKDIVKRPIITKPKQITGLTEDRLLSQVLLKHGSKKDIAIQKWSPAAIRSLSDLMHEKVPFTKTGAQKLITKAWDRVLAEARMKLPTPRMAEKPPSKPVQPSKPEIRPTELEKPPVERKPAEPTTGKPMTIKLYRGIKAKPKGVTFATDAGDLGAGAYWTNYEPTARVYGKGGEVLAETKSFKNPLVLSSKEAVKLSEKYKTVNAPMEERLAGARQMSKDLRKQGYDALIVEGYDVPKDYLTIVDLAKPTPAEPTVEAKPTKEITVRKDVKEVFDEDYWLRAGYTKPTAKSMAILDKAIESAQGRPQGGGLYPWSVMLTPEASKKLGVGFRYDAIKKGSTVLGVEPENFDKLRKQGYRIKGVQAHQEIITTPTELHKIAQQWETLKEKPAEVKAGVSKGKVGFPARPAGAPMPMAMEPIAKEPISAEKIITRLSKALKVPYASMATHRPRRAAGWYEVKPRGIRQINVRDLETASHEAGHHVDHFYKIRQAGISKAGRKTWKMPEGTAKGTAAELMKLGKMLYGGRKPPSGYKSEGIAEFVRGYLTGHLDIQKEAPNFYKWFMQDYLPNNPEVATALNNSRDMLTDYRLQGAEARIESQISRKEIRAALLDRARNANLWLQEMFVDEFAPLRKGMEEAGIERKKLKPTEDPYELAVFFTQKEGARARQMVLFGTIDLWGNKTGKGLKEIMKPIADENAVRPFTHWVVSARALDLRKRGINPGISKADAQHVYDLYKNNPGWKEAAKEITDWNGRVLNYLVQAGALESGVAKRMRELNPMYVPFLRAFVKGEKRFGGGGAGKGLITTKKGVFSIKGSGREIIDPFESMITQTRRMLSIAHKSVIARALANLEAKHRGLAGFIWKVPPPKKATTFRSEQAIKQLQKMGVDVTGADADALMTVYGNSPIYLGKENIIAIVQNGKKTWYEVSPEMYRLLQGLDKFYLPRFLDIALGKAGRTVRLGATGINASFGLVKNPIRDSLDTIFKGTHARGPLASVQGIAKDLSRMGFAKSLGINPSKAAQEYVAMGGQISGFVGQDRKSLQHLRGEMLASSVGRHTIHTVKHPIDALRQVFGVPESGPRIQEYEKALKFAEKKYGKGSPDAKVYAFNKAQDQTINYSRHGVIGKWLNQMIPFWNANAQDISKVHRTFRTRGKEATAYAVAFLTLPALGLWWYNKDEEWYKELPAYEKANYLHVKIPGKDSILRIPVPFLVGHIFQGFPVTITDALYRADKTRVTNFFKEALKGDVYSLTEWPAIVSPIIDVLQNKDWAGRPIVPKGVEGKLPSDQYKEYTTEFCKEIGKVFNISPAKVEHLLNSWSGGLYRRAGRIAELPRRPAEEVQPADWPLIGAIMVRDPYAPRQSIDRFYKRAEHLERAYQSEKISSAELVERIKYTKARPKLSPLWEKLQKTKIISERKKLHREIAQIAREAQKPMTNSQLWSALKEATYKASQDMYMRAFVKWRPHKGKEDKVTALKEELRRRKKGVK